MQPRRRRRASCGLHERAPTAAWSRMSWRPRARPRQRHRRPHPAHPPRCPRSRSPRRSSQCRPNRPRPPGRGLPPRAPAACSCAAAARPAGGSRRPPPAAGSDALAAPAESATQCQGGGHVLGAVAASALLPDDPERAVAKDGHHVSGAPARAGAVLASVGPDLELRASPEIALGVKVPLGLIGAERELGVGAAGARALVPVHLHLALPRLGPLSVPGRPLAERPHLVNGGSAVDPRRPRGARRVGLGPVARPGLLAGLAAFLVPTEQRRLELDELAAQLTELRLGRLLQAGANVVLVDLLLVSVVVEQVPLGRPAVAAGGPPARHDRAESLPLDHPPYTPANPLVRAGAAWREQPSLLFGVVVVHPSLGQPLAEPRLGRQVARGQAAPQRPDRRHPSPSAGARLNQQHRGRWGLAIFEIIGRLRPRQLPVQRAVGITAKRPQPHHLLPLLALGSQLGGPRGRLGGGGPRLSLCLCLVHREQPIGRLVPRFVGLTLALGWGGAACLQPADCLLGLLARLAGFPRRPGSSRSCGTPATHGRAPPPQASKPTRPLTRRLVPRPSPPCHRAAPRVPPSWRLDPGCSRPCAPPRAVHTRRQCAAPAVRAPARTAGRALPHGATAGRPNSRPPAAARPGRAGPRRARRGRTATRRLCRPLAGATARSAASAPRATWPRPHPCLAGARAARAARAAPPQPRGGRRCQEGGRASVWRAAHQRRRAARRVVIPRPGLERGVLRVEDQLEQADVQLADGAHLALAAQALLELFEAGRTAALQRQHVRKAADKLPARHERGGRLAL
eukprot:scaffold32199_cov108-Isochrysis_galbana.AAC.2